MRRSSTLTLGPLVAVMYFTVSGGPFGLEGLVGSVGPGVALLLLLLTPVVFSVPETLLVGELASMLPAEGGYYVWVKRAFGRFWGFWNGWLSWVYSLIDMAIYPVLFLQYVRFFAPGLGRFEGWLLALALIWGATWLNLKGACSVGAASGWFVAAVLAPFALLAAVALARWLFGPTPVLAPRPCAAARHGRLPGHDHPVAGADRLAGVDRRGVARPRGVGGGAVARGLARPRRHGQRVRPVQRPAARLFPHPIGAGAGRAAPAGARRDGRARHAAQRRARLGGRVFGVRAAVVRRAARGRRAALQRGAGARVRGAARAAPARARSARGVPRAARD